MIMGVGRNFSRGALGDFFKIFLGEAKSGKIWFRLLEIKKITFLLKILKSRGAWPSCPPSDAHATDTTNHPTVSALNIVNWKHHVTDVKLFFVATSTNDAMKLQASSHLVIIA